MTLSSHLKILESDVLLFLLVLVLISMSVGDIFVTEIHSNFLFNDFSSCIATSVAPAKNLDCAGPGSCLQ